MQRFHLREESKNQRSNIFDVPFHGFGFLVERNKNKEKPLEEKVCSKMSQWLTQGLRCIQDFITCEDIKAYSVFF